jgi:hypothetical protein
MRWESALGALESSSTGSPPWNGITTVYLIFEEPNFFALGVTRVGKSQFLEFGMDRSWACCVTLYWVAFPHSVGDLHT